MERFQGPLISSCFFGEHLEVNSLVDRERLKLEEGDEQSSLEEDNNMPFLQMLQSPQFIPFDSAAWRRGSKTQVGTREPRKRKRTRETKKKEEVEKQRMTHIAVERNRRRQMNDHLSVLKSLMPPSYIQRGDHASIIGGAIDFVKELEQLLESLEAQKRMRRNEDVVSNSREDGYGMSSSTEEVNCAGDEMWAEKKSKTMAVEVTVIQSYVKLKIQCQRRPEEQGQLIKAVVALENLGLTILHLNITSSQATVLYSFNLKIEEDSNLVSASEIAEAVDHIFSCIN